MAKEFRVSECTLLQYILNKIFNVFLTCTGNRLVSNVHRRRCKLTRAAETGERKSARQAGERRGRTARTDCSGGSDGEWQTVKLIFVNGQPVLLNDHRDGPPIEV